MTRYEQPCKNGHPACSHKLHGECAEESRALTAAFHAQFESYLRGERSRPDFGNFYVANGVAAEAFR